MCVWKYESGVLFTGKIKLAAVPGEEQFVRSGRW